MKLHIEYNFNGKQFTNYDDAVAAAIFEGYKRIVEKKLTPFSAEINDCGGKISINYNSYDHGADVSLHDFPKELSEKLTHALSE